MHVHMWREEEGGEREDYRVTGREEGREGVLPWKRTIFIMVGWRGRRGGPWPNERKRIQKGGRGS